jgi:hypothetical protein
MTANVSALPDIQDESLRTATFRLFEEAQELVDSGEVDVVVLTARRLPCLYQVLVDLGMPLITGADVISSRAIDTISDWHWSSALVLDDNVILGSTLANLADQLRSKGIERIRTRAICLDEEQAAPFLLRSAHASGLVATDSKSIESFSVAIIRTLYRHGRPLFSDFPVGVEFEVSRGDWLEFVGGPGWRVAEVTAPRLEDCERKALVKVPTAAHQQHLFAGLPRSLVNLIDVGKLRAYVRDQSDDRIAARLVPICLMKPCRFEDLDIIIRDLSELGIPDSIAVWFLALSSETKYRLIQYLTSVYLLYRANYLSLDLGGRSVPVGLDGMTLELNFGDGAANVKAVLELLELRASQPHDPALINPLALDQPRPYELLKKRDLQRLLWEQQEVIARAEIPTSPATGEITKVGLAFSHAVASIFGYIGEAYEKPQRRKIAGLADLAGYRRFTGHAANFRMLSSGFTLQELATLLALTSSPEDEWGNATITLALDIGNDLGIVVPITKSDDARGLVYRCFRLGETAVLASTPFGVGQWEGASLDAYTASYFGGYPLHSKLHSLLDFPEVCGRTSPGVKPRKARLQKDLDRFIRGALPGRPEARYQGSILTVDEGEFITVALSTVDGIDAGVSDLRWDVIESDDSSAVREGADVVWTVFSRMEEGNRLVSSRVRVVPEPNVSETTRQIIADQLLELLGND